MRKYKLEDIGALIEDRFRDADFCVKSICHEMGIGMSSLHEFLSVKCGMTPHELIEERRLMEAIKLMRLEHSSLGAIVRASGFSNMRTFRRVFKKRIGLPPSEAAERLNSSPEKERFSRECIRKLSEVGTFGFVLCFMTPEEMTGRFDRKNSILTEQ